MEGMHEVVLGGFVDVEKLERKLKQRFGDGNFKVKLRLNIWTMYVPEVLTEVSLVRREVRRADGR